MARHGGQILIDQLQIQGVDRLFCLPGESFLAVLDSLFDAQIETVVGRHEGGVAMMAEAHGKLTGRPGVALVTRGPGATNASAGVHVARQDSTPMVLLIGQVKTDQRDREAFQEVDYRRMFNPLAKWVAEVDRTERLPEYVSRAFHVAVSGRPGPVVLSLPEDVLSARAHASDAPPARPAAMGASDEDVEAVLAILKRAERPFVLVGGGAWSAAAARDLAVFSENGALPVGVSFRCQDYIDNRASSYVGDLYAGMNPDLAARVKDADVLLTLGARLGGATTSDYTLIEPPTPRQTLIHVHSDVNELGAVYAPALAIAASPPALLRRLAAAAPAPRPGWPARLAEARASYLAWRAPEETPGDLTLEKIVRMLSERLPDDAIVTNGAGAYAGCLHRHFCYKTYRTQLAPTSGSMGYSLPAAIAAKLTHPEREVVCFTGDGCFQMTMQEFGVAAQRGAAIIVLIANNGAYGSIQARQERAYPGRVVGAQLRNPDFALLARSYGGFGETVARTEDFWDAFARARASGVPAILDLKMDPRTLSPDVSR